MEINDGEKVIPNKVLIKERLKEEDKIFKERCKGCPEYGRNNQCLDADGNLKGDDCNFFKEAKIEAEAIVKQENKNGE